MSGSSSYPPVRWSTPGAPTSATERKPPPHKPEEAPGSPHGSERRSLARNTTSVLLLIYPTAGVAFMHGPYGGVVRFARLMHRRVCVLGGLAVRAASGGKLILPGRHTA